MSLLSSVLNGVREMKPGVSFKFTLENVTLPQRWKKLKDPAKTKLTIDVHELPQSGIHFLHLRVPGGFYYPLDPWLRMGVPHDYLIEPIPGAQLKLHPGALRTGGGETIDLPEDTAAAYMVWLDSVLEKYTLAPSWATTMPAILDRLNYDYRIEEWSQEAGGVIDIVLASPYYAQDEDREYRTSLTALGDPEDLFDSMRRVESISFDDDRIMERTIDVLGDDDFTEEEAGPLFRDAVELQDLVSPFDIADYIAREIEDRRLQGEE